LQVAQDELFEVGAFFSLGFGVGSVLAKKRLQVGHSFTLFHRFVAGLFAQVASASYSRPMDVVQTKIFFKDRS
jgi:hypothetical protein